MTRPAKIVILGCGFTGMALVPKALARGYAVSATTRKAENAGAIVAKGARALVLPSLGLEALAAHVDKTTAVIATFPPDGATDEAIAPIARMAFATAYVSSTGVYGSVQGAIDDDTKPAPDSPRTKARLVAEDIWASAGATVLRSPAIYGPFRGMHRRVKSGASRIAGDGSHCICRIHVDDLAEALICAVERQLGAARFVLADDEPAPQGEVVRYLAHRLGVPVPPSVPLDSVDESLRHDRRIDARRFKERAGLSWAYPNYRVGFEACLAAEGD